MAKITTTNTKEINSLTTNVAVILSEVSHIKSDVIDVKKKIGCLGDDYVSKMEFSLVNNEQNKRIGQIEKLVFGAIGLALITLGKAILELVVTVKAAQ